MIFSSLLTSMINYTTTKATKHIDKRGFLVDFLKGSEIEQKHKKLGQIYFVTFEGKNVIRGNHVHYKKDEWFVVVRGKLKVILEDLKTKERVTFVLDGDSDKYERVYVERNIAHAFVSLTKSAEMINYASKSYDPKHPDINPYIVT